MSIRDSKDVDWNNWKKIDELFWKNVAKLVVEEGIKRGIIDTKHRV